MLNWNWHWNWSLTWDWIWNWTWNWSWNWNWNWNWNRTQQIRQLRQFILLARQHKQIIPPMYRHWVHWVYLACQYCPFLPPGEGERERNPPEWGKGHLALVCSPWHAAFVMDAFVGEHRWKLYTSKIIHFRPISKACGSGIPSEGHIVFKSAQTWILMGCLNNEELVLCQVQPRPQPR